ncbi:non-specific serine/threonine protein kinase [Trifolium repens]|nr:non-specific serine/threonine protein kinase [Trifolium repens]
MVSSSIPSHTLFLALMFFSAIHILLQLPQTNGTNFSYPLNSTLSYDTYVAYSAQSPNFLTLTSISDIFDTSPLSIARASNIKDENMNLIPGQLLLVPITCGCSGNGNYSFANISHLIKQGESFYYLSTIPYQNLTNWMTVEDSNPNLNPYMLTVGTKVVIPIFCSCPSKGIEYLITYIWKPNDNLTLVASMFGASPQDIITANANKFGQNFTAAANLPVFIPVKNLPALPQLYSSLERKRNNHFHIIISIGMSLGCTLLISLSLLLVYVYCLRKRKACENKCVPSKLISEVSNYVSKPEVYEVSMLMQATMNLNERCRIGKSMYKAQIDGHVLAVKNVKEDITVTEELMILQKVNHANLVKLIGVSSGYDGVNHFLVYEYAENGSLYNWLFSEFFTLSWNQSENAEGNMLWKDIKGVFDIEEKREESVRRWIDPKLGSFYNVVEAMSLFSLAMNCIKEQLLLRPTMGEIVLSLSLLTQHSPTLLERSCNYGLDVEVITGMVNSIIAR